MPALEAAERSARIARAAGDSAGIIMSEWMLGVTHHVLGNQAAAQRHCEHGLKLSAPSNQIYLDLSGYDHFVRVLIILARVQWLRGRPERALAFADQAIEEAVRRDHPVTVCLSLVYLIPVFLWAGEIDKAQEGVERLIAYATKYSRSLSLHRPRIEGGDPGHTGRDKCRRPALAGRPSGASIRSPDHSRPRLSPRFGGRARPLGRVRACEDRNCRSDHVGGTG